MTRTGLLSLLFATSALAAPVTAAAQASGEGAQSTAGAPREVTALEEIVVTAQKVASNLQDAPAAIAVISQDRLATQGVTDVRAVQFMVPNIRLNKQQATVQMFIRGVGIATDSPSIDSGVAMTVNGVEQFREATGASLFDIERVEVLRGPQGTTYGSNAAGGVISVVTARPSNDYSGKAVVELGNYERRYVSAAQNLPLGETSQLRAAVDYLRRDGYAANGLDDQKNYAGRLTFTTELGENADLMVWGSAYHAGGRGDVGYASPFINPSDPWKQTWDPTALISVGPEQRTRKRNVDIFEFGAELNWRLGGATLTYIPGYIESDAKGHLAIDTGAVRVLFDEVSARTQYTHELRLASADPTSRLKWLAGLYYYELNTHAFRTVAANISFDIPKQPSKTYAGYLQTTYSLSDALRLTGGLRYSHIEKSARGNRFTPPPLRTPIPFSAAFEWNHVDWKVGAEYDLTPDSMLYATVQTGYLGGGVNFFNSATLSSEVKPEKLLSYQVGMKNTLLDGRMRLNGEAYYYDWKNYQVGLLNVGAGTSVVFNVPKSEAYGVEFDLQYALTAHDELSLSGGYFHGQFKDFVVAPGVSSPVRGYNFNGFALPFAPDWSASLYYQHVFDLSNGSTINASAQVQYASSFWTSFSHGVTRCVNVPTAVLPQSACVDRGVLQPPSGIANLDLTWNSPDKRLSLGVWVRNVTEEVVRASGGDGGLSATGALTSRAATTLVPPRTYGVRLSANW